MSDFTDQFLFPTTPYPSIFRTLGGEVEVWTVDPDTDRLVSVSKNIFGPGEGDSMTPNGVVYELPAHQLEMRTGVCPTPMAFVADLESGEAEIARMATAHGFAVRRDPVMWYNDYQLEIYPHNPRYPGILAKFEADGRREELRTGAWIIGLHVHVGCNNLEEAVIVFNGLRRCLPAFLSLGARSSTIYGEDRGNASERFLTYQNFNPRLVPPFLESVEHYESLAKDGQWLQDPSGCWWLIRINHKFGTVEVRVFDTPETAADAGELAALVQALAAMALSGEPQSRPLSVEGMAFHLNNAATRRDSLGYGGNAVLTAISFLKRHGRTQEAEMLRNMQRRLGLDTEYRTGPDWCTALRDSLP